MHPSLSSAMSYKLIASVTLGSQHHLFNSRVGQILPRFPIPPHPTEECSAAIYTSLRQLAGAAIELTSYVSHVSGVTVLCSLMSSVLKTLIYYILSFWGSCFRYKGKSNPCYSILARRIVPIIASAYEYM